MNKKFLFLPLMILGLNAWALDESCKQAQSNGMLKAKSIVEYTNTADNWVDNIFSNIFCLCMFDSATHKWMVIETDNSNIWFLAQYVDSHLVLAKYDSKEAAHQAGQGNCRHVEDNIPFKNRTYDTKKNTLYMWEIYNWMDYYERKEIPRYDNPRETFPIDFLGKFTAWKSDMCW